MPHPLASGLTYVYPLCGLVFIMITLKLASIQQNKAQDVFCLCVYSRHYPWMLVSFHLKCLALHFMMSLQHCCTNVLLLQLSRFNSRVVNRCPCQFRGSSTSLSGLPGTALILGVRAVVFCCSN